MRIGPGCRGLVRRMWVLSNLDCRAQVCRGPGCRGRPRIGLVCRGLVRRAQIQSKLGCRRRVRGGLVRRGRSRIGPGWRVRSGTGPGWRGLVRNARVQSNLGCRGRVGSGPVCRERLPIGAVRTRLVRRGPGRSLGRAATIVRRWSQLVGRSVLACRAESSVAVELVGRSVPSLRLARVERPSRIRRTPRRWPG